MRTTNRQTINKLQIALSSFGVKSWIVKNQPKKIKWKNGIYTSRTSYNLQIAPRNSLYFKENIGFYSNYKNNRIKKFEKQYNRKLIIKEISSVGEKEVWDFQSPTS